MKIHSEGSELSHADGLGERQRDRHDEANSLFRNFVNVSKNAVT